VGWLTGRGNDNNVDLNRDFPYLAGRMMESKKRNEIGVGKLTYLPIEESYFTSGVQPETFAIIKWTEDRNFVLSAMIHSGAWAWYFLIN